MSYYVDRETEKKRNKDAKNNTAVSFVSNKTTQAMNRHLVYFLLQIMIFTTLVLNKCCINV